MSEKDYKKYFYRFQGREKLEYTSAHIDIPEIFLRLENNENEDTIFDIYYETLNMRKISPEILFEKIKNCKTLKEAQNLTLKYSLNGVCCFAFNDIENIEKYKYEDFTGDSIVANANFVIVFEGKYLGDCGDGEVAKPKKIIKIFKKGDDKKK